MQHPHLRVCLLKPFQGTVFIFYLAFDHHSRAKRIRLDTTETLGKETESNYGRLQRALASSSNNLGIAFNTIRTEVCSRSLNFPSKTDN